MAVAAIASSAHRLGVKLAEVSQADAERIAEFLTIGDNSAPPPKVKQPFRAGMLYVAIPFLIPICLRG
ncbi:hypothetical protein [Rhodoblastus sp.]|uniref:hypothetical protein n=1 Tax=Rhodoblastus sp. TaxID=1962975 RepID=UPI00263398F5|nr:hypothetical protein [Rhodoblastus sp.]